MTMLQTVWQTTSGKQPFLGILPPRSPLSRQTQALIPSSYNGSDIYVFGIHHVRRLLYLTKNLLNGPAYRNFLSWK